MEHIGFVGAGLMGEGMAASALRKGHRVTVVAHRSRDAIERLKAAGAQEAPDLPTLARSVDVVAMCVTDAPAVESVIERLRPGLAPGQLVIDMTTSYPEVTRRLAAELAKDGVRLVDAPVTGGPEHAEAGELGTLLGAAPEDVERASAVVSSWSKVVSPMGDVGSGHTAKLINNFVSQGTHALLGEAFRRARQAGVDWQALYDAMAVGGARSAALERSVKPAIAGNYDGVRFALSNAAKDVRYFAAMVEEMDGEPSPLATAVRDVLARYVEAGHGDKRVSRQLDPEICVG